MKTWLELADAAARATDPAALHPLLLQLIDADARISAVHAASDQAQVLAQALGEKWRANPNDLPVLRVLLALAQHKPCRRAVIQHAFASFDDLADFLDDPAAARTEALTLLQVSTRRVWLGYPCDGLCRVLRWILRYVASASSTEDQACLVQACGALASLCHASDSVTAFLRAQADVDTLYRALLAFLHHSSLILVLYSLSALSALLQDHEIGDKLFSHRNIDQSLTLVFRFLSDPDTCAEASAADHIGHALDLLRLLAQRDHAGAMAQVSLAGQTGVDILLALIQADTRQRWADVVDVCDVLTAASPALATALAVRVAAPAQLDRLIALLRAPSLTPSADVSLLRLLLTAVRDDAAPQDAADTLARLCVSKLLPCERGAAASPSKPDADAVRLAVLTTVSALLTSDAASPADLRASMLLPALLADTASRSGSVLVAQLRLLLLLVPEEDTQVAASVADLISERASDIGAVAATASDSPLLASVLQLVRVLPLPSLLLLADAMAAAAAERDAAAAATDAETALDLSTASSLNSALARCCVDSAAQTSPRPEPQRQRRAVAVDTEDLSSSGTVQVPTTPVTPQAVHASPLTARTPAAASPAAASPGSRPLLLQRDMVQSIATQNEADLSLTQQIASLVTENEALKDLLEMRSASLSRADTLLAAATSRRAQADAELLSVQAELTRVVKQVENAAQREQRHADELRRMAESRATTQAAIAERAKELTDAARVITELREQVSVEAAERNNLRVRVDALEEQLRQVSAALTRTSDELASVHSQLSETSAQLATAKRQATEATASAAAAEKAAARRVEGSDGEIARLRQSHQQALQDLQEQCATAERVSQRVAGLEREVDQWQVASKRHELEAARERDQAQRYALETSRLQSVCRVLQGDVARLEKVCSAINQLSSSAGAGAGTLLAERSDVANMSRSSAAS